MVIGVSDVPDAEVDRLADRGFDWIWLLGVRKNGLVGKNVSLQDPGGHREFRDLLGPVAYERNGDDVLMRGLYVDLPAWGYNIFAEKGISS